MGFINSPYKLIKWVFIYEPTPEEKFAKVLIKVRRLMKKGISNEDIRNWIIRTGQPVQRIWIRNKPRRRITLALSDERWGGIYHFGYVTEMNGNYIALIPALNQL